MPEGRIPRGFLYGELASGKRTTRQPQLQYSDVVKHDMKAVDINTESWEGLAANWSKWRGALTNQLKAGEEKLTQVVTEKWACRKLSGRSNRPEIEHKCDLSKRDYQITHRSLQPQMLVFQPNRLGCDPWSTLTDGGLPPLHENENKTS